MKCMFHVDGAWYRSSRGCPKPDNSCDSDSSLAKAPFLILARQSGSLQGTCLVQTFCLSQGQLKPFGCLDLHPPAPTGGNFMKKDVCGGLRNRCKKAMSTLFLQAVSKMTEMKKQLRVMVVAAVIEKHGRVLIAQRRKDGRLGGEWEFPGGKVEPDETPEQALRRELHEELGIEAEIGEFFCSSRYDYTHLPVELHAYRIKDFSGEIVPHVHDQVLWVLPQDLYRYDFPEANREIMSRLTDRA